MREPVNVPCFLSQKSILSLSTLEDHAFSDDAERRRTLCSTLLQFEQQPFYERLQSVYYCMSTTGLYQLRFT